MSTTEIAPIDVGEVVARFGDLPTLAPVAVEVLRLADDDRASLEDIGDVIARDPGLASQMLRVANSPTYGMAAEITSLARAAAVLGLRTVKLLSLSFSVVARPAADDPYATRVWRHTLVSSAVARVLATRYAPRIADECFIAALLGNVGKLALADHPRHVEAAAEHGWLDRDAELRLLGVASADVAAEILAGWSLPAVLFDAVRHTADPSAATGAAEQVATVLHVADAAGVLLTADEEDTPDALSAYVAAAASSLELDAEVAETVLEECEEAVAEIASLFQTPQPTDLPVVDLLLRAKERLARISLDMVAALSQQETRSEALETENERLSTEALVDPLTGLANRRSFDQTLEGVIAGRIRRPEPHAVGLLMMDLDHFKSVNDTHGHQVGDEVLLAFSSRLSLNTRRDEFAARVGGEEFVIVIPMTDEAEIGLAAERFRRCIADEPFATEIGPLTVTVSIGGACTEEIDATTATGLYKAADDALYEAKAAGRNCFLVSKMD